MIIRGVLVPLVKALQWHSRNLHSCLRPLRGFAGCIWVVLVFVRWNSESDTRDVSGKFISHNKIILWCLSTKSHQKRKFYLKVVTSCSIFRFYWSSNIILGQIEFETHIFCQFDNSTMRVLSCQSRNYSLASPQWRTCTGSLYWLFVLCFQTFWPWPTVRNPFYTVTQYI